MRWTRFTAKSTNACSRNTIWIELGIAKLSVYNLITLQWLLTRGTHKYKRTVASNTPVRFEHKLRQYSADTKLYTSNYWECTCFPIQEILHVGTHVDRGHLRARRPSIDPARVTWTVTP